MSGRDGALPGRSHRVPTRGWPGVGADRIVDDVMHRRLPATGASSARSWSWARP